MTLRVIIENGHADGSMDAKVQQVSRTLMYRDGSPLVEQEKILPPGERADFYVHSGVDLLVQEQERQAPAV